MKNAIAILLFGAAPLSAGELPELFDKPWTSWYSGYEGKRFHFGVDPDGEASLMPINKKDKNRVSQHSFFRILPNVVETMPNGRQVIKKPKEDGWEAVTPESAEAEKVHFRGTVTGGATYEVIFEIDGDEVFASGQILDKGEIENPVHFEMQVRVPNTYRHTKDEDQLEDKLKGDRFDFVLTNRKKAKFKGTAELGEVMEECESVRSARVEIDYYQGARLELDGSDLGAIVIKGKDTSPVGKGFTFIWKPDPAKNAGAKAKLTMQFK